MPSPNFSRLFNPRGVAIIGASAEPGRAGTQSVIALQEHGYAGGIFPVNPKYPEISGLRCFASVTDITDACDVAVIALPAAQVLQAIEQCGQRAIGFAVVLGGGFREAGPDGVVREAAMLKCARSSRVRLIGPNCLGYVNIPHRVFAGFGSITRPPYLKPGPVSAVIQSGGFGNSMVVEAALAGLGFQNVVASGNETDISAAELISAFVDDPGTKLILAYLEGIQDGRAFMAAAQRALNAGKPVVVLKGGNSRQGSRVATSHTASMTGSYDIYRAAFRQCGVIEVRDVDDAVDTLRALTCARLPRGRNVAVIGGSGGAAVNFSDAADTFGLTLTPLAARTEAILRKVLPGIATTDNPVDYTAGFLTPANMPRFQTALEALLDDPDVHQVGLLLGTGSGPGVANLARVTAAAAGRSDKPILACASSAIARDNVDFFAQAGITVLSTPRRMAACMGRLADYAQSRCRVEAAQVEFSPGKRPDLPAGAATLDEHAAKRILAAFNIQVTHDMLLPTDPLPTTLPPGLKFPVAVKIVSPDIAHKTDIDAVRLNITNDDQLTDAAAAVVTNARRAAPQAALSGILVSEMVSDGLETIIGVVNDALFGPVVAFGLGGTLAEILQDLTYRVAPFGIDTAREMVAELKAAAVFAGFRGRAPRDTEAVAAMLARVSELAWLLRDRIQEMDINPVLVGARGSGANSAVAADALIILNEHAAS